MKMKYAGWPNCHRLTNGKVELVATADVGPRIIRFGFAGGPNIFKEYADMVGRKGGREWLIYGGHRLWHAPEDAVRTYHPDNFPVAVKEGKGSLTLVQPVEPTTGIRKEMEISLAGKKAQARVVHRLVNTGPWPVELSAWALSVMAPGGRAIVPLPPRGPHPQNLPAANTLSLWAYTDLSDPRWTLGRKYVMLRQDPAVKSPQKMGLLAPDGWAAYARGGQLFLKKAAFAPGARYPDLGANLELFTNEDMLEVETLSPLAVLPPGGKVEHEENWFLFHGVPEPKDDAEVERHVLPRVREAKA